MWEACESPDYPGLWVVHQHTISSEKLFPHRWEAQYYARIRTEGFSDMDAMRLIHIERVWHKLEKS